MPILHSKDLVNWELIGHVYAAQQPLDVFSKPQHGNGAWAPAIRYRNGEFYIYYPDPDYGIYVVKAKNPAGPWSAPLLVKEAKGWIDPCPLWDDDGKAYLVNALAGSRSAMKSMLIVSRMSPDGTKLLDGGALVYDGHAEDPTVEGPKFYKRNGYYYIFAPAGGVAPGWQLALRSKKVYGPYERKIVLAQGHTPINGPHQGAWVDTPTGESWFIHFQDKGAYGRIVHLEPMKWVDDWPVMGANGEPVLTYRKPNVGKTYPVMTPADTDEFNGSQLGLQWQWAANPKPGWVFPAGGLGLIRLFCIPLPEEFQELLGCAESPVAEVPRPPVHRYRQGRLYRPHRRREDRADRDGNRLRLSRGGQKAGGPGGVADDLQECRPGRGGKGKRAGPGERRHVVSAREGVGPGASACSVTARTERISRPPANPSPRAPAGGLAPKWVCSRFAPVRPPKTVTPISTGSESSRIDT